MQLAESDSHDRDAGLLVREVVLRSNAPDHVRRASEHVLAQFGSAWSDVGVVASLAPASAEDAEAWLVAVRSEPLRSGAVVHGKDGSWASTASRQAFARGQTNHLFSVHVMEKVTIDSVPPAHQ